MARRRLAELAMNDRGVRDALAAGSVTSTSGGPPDDKTSEYLASTPWASRSAQGAPAADLALELEYLAQDIAATPGAGGALIASFAEQSRVLQLVAEAQRRAPHLPLPAEVLAAVFEAVSAVGSGNWSTASP